MRDALERAIELIDQGGIDDPPPADQAAPAPVLRRTAQAHRHRDGHRVRSGILDLLRGLKHEPDAGILLITHNMGVVADIADRVVAMLDGAVVESGDVSQILREPQHPCTRLQLSAMPRLSEGVAAEQAPDEASTPRRAPTPGGTEGGRRESRSPRRVRPYPRSPGLEHSFHRKPPGSRRGGLQRRLRGDLRPGRGARIGKVHIDQYDPGLLDVVPLPASVIDRYPDEPTSALDVSVQASVLEMFRGLQEQYSFACLFVSHDLAVVDSLAHQVLVMPKRRTVEQGSTGHVLRHARQDYTRRLLAAAPVPDPAEQTRRRQERRRMPAAHGESGP
ncbi:hypothetical protein GCM10027060_19180 [Nesterenkonia halophila]